MNYLLRCSWALALGLQLPVAYLAMPAIWFIAEVSRWIRKPTVTHGEVVNLALFVGFSLAYFFKAITFGFADWPSALGWGLNIPIMYATGLLVGRDIGKGEGSAISTRGFSSAFFAGLGLILGCVTYVFLTVLFRYDARDIFSDDYFKVVPGIWTGNPINRPALGALASLGMCLVGVLLFWRAIIASLYGTTVVILTALAVGMSTYANLVLANRTPWLAMIVALLVSMLLWLRVNGTRLRLLKSSLVLSFGGILLYLFWDEFAARAQEIYAVSRFMSEGLDTAGRYESWAAMTSNLLSSPGGGRVADIAGNSYVHNLWLDVSWDAGLVALIFLVIFHIRHIPSIGKLLYRRTGGVARVLLVCSTISFFTNFMQEPTMAASPLYFGIASFFLGLVYRHSLIEDNSRLKNS